MRSPHKGHYRFHFPHKRFNLHLEAYIEKHLVQIPRRGPLQQNNIFSLFLQNKNKNYNNIFPLLRYKQSARQIIVLYFFVVEYYHL